MNRIAALHPSVPRASATRLVDARSGTSSGSAGEGRMQRRVAR